MRGPATRPPVVERVLTALDAGAVTAAFTSTAAITQAVLSTLRPGDHVIYDSGTYYEFAAGIRDSGARWGIEVRGESISPIPRRPRRTRLVWAECPTNPM